MCYDVIIIGAGPAGLTAGIYAKSKAMNTLILESGRVGGQLVSLYPEKGVHNYPGFETIQARKLSDRLYAQAESVGCVIKEFEKVETIENGEDELLVTTTKDTYHTKSIIIAIGMGSFKPKRMGCPGVALDHVIKAVFLCQPQPARLLGAFLFQNVARVAHRDAARKAASSQRTDRGRGLRIGSDRKRKTERLIFREK